jgi:hypothetical protein
VRWYHTGAWPAWRRGEFAVRATPASVVLAVHEISGLTLCVRTAADQFTAIDAEQLPGTPPYCSTLLLVLRRRPPSW